MGRGGLRQEQGGDDDRGQLAAGLHEDDYPSIKYKVVELPTGPTGTKGTLAFTDCWGIAASTKNVAQAKAFVSYLTAPATQMKFADAFGVIPSVQSAKAEYLAKFRRARRSSTGSPTRSAFSTHPG